MVVHDSNPSIAESVVSLALCVALAAGLLISWDATGRTAYLVGAAGFFVLAPIW